MGRRNHPTVLLADDHTFFREGFKLLLEHRYEIVGLVADGHALLAEATALRPDVIVSDIDMPGLDGIEAVRRLKKILPDSRVIFLTGHDNPDFARQALLVGAAGFLHKSSSHTELFDAIDAALQGQIYVTPEFVQAMAAPAEPSRPDEILTDRQQQVLRLLAQGKTMKEAASRLHLTARTIADHKYRIMEKLGVENNAELIQYAIRHRLV